MKLEIIHLLSALALFFSASPAPAQSRPKPLLVHYMSWFQTKTNNNRWGWHWTMGSAAINPEVVGPDGQRQIASWYYPLIGPYDSADPSVIEYHVLLMKLAGIDGVLVDWDGNDDYLNFQMNNQRMAALFKYTRRAGLKFGVVYEPWTIQREVANHYIATNDAILHARQQLLYLQTNYFNDPSYFRLGGKPVMLDFGHAYFKTSRDWTNIFAGLEVTNQPAFFTEDQRLAPVAMGAFDWPPMMLSRSNDDGALKLSGTVMSNFLVNFEQKAAGWPAYVSSAWPRFHDYYAQAGNHSSYGLLDDQNGDTFRETLAPAMTNASAFVQIVTWNDFGEGTVVEPTVEYGYRDLGIVQDFRRRYLDAGFPWHTNDLAIARRIFNLRRQYPDNVAIGAELDGIFSNIVSGKLTAANRNLAILEGEIPKQPPAGNRPP